MSNWMTASAICCARFNYDDFRRLFELLKRDQEILAVIRNHLFRVVRDYERELAWGEEMSNIDGDDDSFLIARRKLVSQLKRWSYDIERGILLISPEKGGEKNAYFLVLLIHHAIALEGEEFVGKYIDIENRVLMSRNSLTEAMNQMGYIFSRTVRFRFYYPLCFEIKEDLDELLITHRQGWSRRLAVAQIGLRAIGYWFGTIWYCLPRALRWMFVAVGLTKLGLGAVN